jgi:hypothetical protein
MDWLKIALVLSAVMVVSVIWSLALCRVMKDRDYYYCEWLRAEDRVGNACRRRLQDEIRHEQELRSARGGDFQAHAAG